MGQIINLVNWAIGILSKTPHLVLATLARFVVGLQFYKSGVQKFDGWFNISDSTIFLFTEEFTGVPLPPVLGANMAAYAEVTFGLFLLIGFASRFSALGLLTMTAVIEIFVYPESYILHGLWAVSLLYIIKYGPCMISVDHIVKKMFGSK